MSKITEKETLALPFFHILVSDCLWGDFPGTVVPTWWEPSKVKLTTHGRLWTACVWDVVRIERHHVTEHVGCTAVIWNNNHLTCTDYELYSFKYTETHSLGLKKNMCVSSDMPKNIRVGRSEKVFFLFLFFFLRSDCQTVFPTYFASFTSK